MTVLLRQQTHLQRLQQLRQMSVTALKQKQSPPCRPGSHVPGICAEGTFRFIKVLSSTGREPSVPFSGNGIELLHKRKKVRRLFRHKLCGRIHDIEFPQESRLSQRNDQQLSKLCIVLNRCAGKDGDAHPQCDAADQRSGIIHHSDHIQIVQRKPPVFQIIERFLFCPRSILPQEKWFFQQHGNRIFQFQTSLKMR